MSKWLPSAEAVAVTDVNINKQKTGGGLWESGVGVCPVRRWVADL